MKIKFKIYNRVLSFPLTTVYVVKELATEKTTKPLTFLGYPLFNNVEK